METESLERDNSYPESLLKIVFYKQDLDDRKGVSW